MRDSKFGVGRACLIHALISSHVEGLPFRRVGRCRPDVRGPVAVSRPITVPIGCCRTSCPCGSFWLLSNSFQRRSMMARKGDDSWKLAPARFAPLKLVPRISASVRFAPSRLASTRKAWLTSARVRLAPRRSALPSCASCRCADVRSAPRNCPSLKSASWQVALASPRLVEYRPGAFCLFHVGAIQPRAGEIRPAHVGALQVCILELCLPERRLAEVGPGKVRPTPVSVTLGGHGIEIGVTQVRRGEFHRQGLDISEDGPFQVGAGQVRLVELRPLEI